LLCGAIPGRFVGFIVPINFAVVEPHVDFRRLHSARKFCKPVRKLTSPEFALARVARRMVIVVILAVIFLGEPLKWKVALGGTLVIAGILLLGMQ
jgi:hypothetical protein